MAAYPTQAPIARRYIVEKRQNGIDSFISEVSSALDGGGNTDGGGSGGTTTSASSTSPTSTISTTITSVSSTQAVSTTSTSTRVRGSNSSTAMVTATSSANNGNGSGDTGSVVTEISTAQGGGTVVVVRTTRAATATANSDSSHSSSSSGAKIGGIVGGVVGGLALITAAVLLFFLWRRRRSRTGNGYFLCFGTRPDRNREDFDVNWPTFDPTLGSAAVGGTLGARSGRNRSNQGPGGTLPDIEDGEGYNPNDDMREVGSSTGQGSYSNGGYYGGAGAAAGALGAAGAASAYSSNPHTGPSEEGHYRNTSQTGIPIGSHTSTDDTVPTYDHLDPPEVRQARAREQAQAHAKAQAQSHAMYGGGSDFNGGGSPEPNYSSQPAPAYYSNASPPPPSNRPLSNHRMSTGSAQAFASNNMYSDHIPEGDGTLPPQTDQQRMLHLHNPDGY